MRAWLSDGLIRLARRINPAARASHDTVIHVHGDPLAAARLVEQRARARQLKHLR